MKKTTSKTKDQKDHGTVFDVARPGKSTPDSSSRPLIVGHRTMLKQDPMVAVTSKAPPDALMPKEEMMLSAPEIPKALEADETPKKSAVRTIKIESSGKPVAEILMKKLARDDVSPVVEEPASGSKELEKPAPGAETADKRQALEVRPPEPEASEDAAADSDSQAEQNEAEEAEKSSDEGAVGAPTDQPGAKKAAEKEAEEAAARQAAYEKLISDKKYFVPIGEKKRKRSLRMGLLLAILLLFAAVAAADLLIDAGVIKTSIKPPVRIFNSK